MAVTIYRLATFHSTKAMEACLREFVENMKENTRK
jgi:hypothetical protein